MSKFKLYSELLNEDQIMSHVFFNCVPEKLARKIAKESHEILKSKTEDEFKKTREIEIKLFIENEEVDCREFFQTLYDQYSSQVDKRAHEIVREQTSEKARELSDKLNNLAVNIDSMINDIDYENNMFKKQL